MSCFPTANSRIRCCPTSNHQNQSPAGHRHHSPTDITNHLCSVHVPNVSHKISSKNCGKPKTCFQPQPEDVQILWISRFLVDQMSREFCSYEKILVPKGVGERREDMKWLFEATKKNTSDHAHAWEIEWTKTLSLYCSIVFLLIHVYFCLHADTLPRKHQFHKWLWCILWRIPLNTAKVG